MFILDASQSTCHRVNVKGLGIEYLPCKSQCLSYHFVQQNLLGVNWWQLKHIMLTSWTTLGSVCFFNPWNIIWILLHNWYQFFFQLYLYVYINIYVFHCSKCVIPSPFSIFLHVFEIHVWQTCFTNFLWF